MGRRNRRFDFAIQEIIWRVALYIRLSREDGSIESLSVGNQKAMLLDYLGKQFVGEYVLVDVYIDDGYTGTDSNRENFQRMLHDIDCGNVNCVIVKDTSRLSRNYVEAGHYMEILFVQKNVRFISLGIPQIDSYLHPETMNSIAVPIQNVINDDFCRQTSDKVRRVFDYKRRNGQYIGAFAPYGYQKDPDDKSCFIIDEDAAQTVRDIFKWFVDGTSKRGIAIKLNELGIPNPSAYKRSKGIKYSNPAIAKGAANTTWNAGTVDKILHDQTYIGHLVQGKETLKSYKVHERVRLSPDKWYITENAHNPIIDNDTFALVQSLLGKDTRAVGEAGKQHLLAGFMRCADCGKAMTRHTSKGTYVAYICRTNNDQGKTACSRHSIPEKVIMDNILAAVQQQIKLVISMADLVDAINERPQAQNKSARLDTLLSDRLSEKIKTQNICDSLYDDLKNDILTNEEYRRLKQKYQMQLEAINSAIERIKEEQSVVSDGITTEHPLFINLTKYHSVTELSRNMLAELIDTVFVHEKQPGDKYPRTEIIFKYADQFELIRDYIEANRSELSKTTDVRTA